ncbi:hypothetical protein DPM33_06380 [Mesorhizobium hawassense]|uniref:Uncharacterized protein n=1 Tax=Mesorhizobium hawassense TaxID=1209954 RepID=A0A330HYD4_9HYPH|nr:hypothetical protein DPM33_06380 [Mesorhizobium hawassense]
MDGHDIALPDRRHSYKVACVHALSQNQDRAPTYALHRPDDLASDMDATGNNAIRILCHNYTHDMPYLEAARGRGDAVNPDGHIRTVGDPHIVDENAAEALYGSHYAGAADAVIVPCSGRPAGAADTPVARTVRRPRESAEQHRWKGGAEC